MEKNTLYVSFFSRVAEADGVVVVEAEVGEEVVEGAVEAVEAEEAEVAVEAADEAVTETEDLDVHPTGSEMI